jgi:hypothetical protein
VQNIKDGFNGTLAIGDKLFPECEDLGLGLIVTAENIAELTTIFMSETLLTAIDESIALGRPVTVEVSDVESAAHWLTRNQWDVDWDNIDGTITIFGDRPSKADEPESWVLRLSESATA